MQTSKSEILKIKMIRKIKRVFLGIGIGSISLWMTGCTDETAQEPDNIYNTYMASGMEEALAADYLAAPGSNVPADLFKYVSEMSCANFKWNNYQYTDLAEGFLYCPMGRNPESVNYYEFDEVCGCSRSLQPSVSI